MFPSSVVEKNKRIFDCAGWVKIRHSLFSRRKVWFMRLLGSSLTLHEAIDKPIVCDYSVIACKVKNALRPRFFSLKLMDGEWLCVSCDSRGEATMWKQALSKASSLVFEDEFQLVEPTQGTDGCTLFNAVDKSDNTQVSVQRIAKDAEEPVSLADVHAHSRQLYAIRTLRHYNLVGATRVFNDVGFAYIVSKRGRKRRLVDVISEYGGKLPEGMARIISIQLVQALQFMHSKGFAHRNIALESMWYDDSDPSERRALLSNFEHVAFVDDEEELRLRGLAGNDLHRAPEMLHGRVYGAAVDLFALGVCVYRMLSGSYPFGDRDDHGTTLVEEMEQGPRFEEEAWNQISPEAKAFVKCLLNPCGLTRMTAKEAEDENWFRIDLPLCEDDTKVNDVGVLERMRGEDKQVEERGERISGSKTRLCKVEGIKALVKHDESGMAPGVNRVVSPLSDENDLVGQ